MHNLNGNQSLESFSLNEGSISPISNTYLSVTYEVTEVQLDFPLSLHSGALKVLKPLIVKKNTFMVKCL